MIRKWTLIGEADMIAQQIRTNNHSEGFNRYLKQIVYQQKKYVGLDRVCVAANDVLEHFRGQLENFGPSPSGKHRPSFTY
jgi:hypothetical protein